MTFRITHKTGYMEFKDFVDFCSRRNRQDIKAVLKLAKANCDEAQRKSVLDDLDKGITTMSAVLSPFTVSKEEHDRAVRLFFGEFARLSDSALKRLTRQRDRLKWCWSQIHEQTWQKSY